MYSSEYLERYYFQYQTEALPHGESLQSFCVKNKVSYNIFQSVLLVSIIFIMYVISPICVVNTAMCCLSFAELKSIMSDGYNAYVFIGDELKSAQFKDTIHQVCMSHAKNKFVKASNQGSEPNADYFFRNFKGILHEGS